MDLATLEQDVRRLGNAILLPSRLAGSVRLDGVPTVRDALRLGDDVALAVVSSGDEIVVSPVVTGSGSARRATAGDGAFAAIAGFVAGARSSGRFTSRTFTDLPELGTERAIDVDQSNDSMVVGETVVVKVYARTTPGPQPGLDLPAHLASVGFDRTPTPYGAVLWAGDRGPGVVLATVSAFLPGARDGWDWYVGLLLDRIDGVASDDDVLRPAEEIGRLVADLHLALATRSEVLPTPVTSVGGATVARWRARADATLQEALAVADGDVAVRLRALADDARAAFEGFDLVEETPVMRIHGDLHVGQVLRWEGGYAVSDFDGNPLAPPEARVAMDTPARDVASMVRALDHVGRVVQRRRPTAAPQVDAWIVDARIRFLSAYRGAIGDASLFDERLLFALEVAQECHEHVYAARYLPRWSYVPDLALPALLRSRP